MTKLAVEIPLESFTKGLMSSQSVMDWLSYRVSACCG